MGDNLEQCLNVIIFLYACIQIYVYIHTSYIYMKNDYVNIVFSEFRWEIPYNNESNSKQKIYIKVNVKLMNRNAYVI